MNVDNLIHRYFKGNQLSPTIIVYFELHSNKEINPNDIVDNRTDCEGQFNDEFIKEDELDNLW